MEVFFLAKPSLYDMTFTGDIVLWLSWCVFTVFGSRKVEDYIGRPELVQSDLAAGLGESPEGESPARAPINC